MTKYYWVDTDKWALRDAVLDIVSEGDRKIVDVVVLQDEEVWVLVREG